jgi:hypothetical protein
MIVEWGLFDAAVALTGAAGAILFGFVIKPMVSNPLLISMASLLAFLTLFNAFYDLWYGFGG